MRLRERGVAMTPPTFMECHNGHFVAVHSISRSKRQGVVRFLDGSVWEWHGIHRYDRVCDRDLFILVSPKGSGSSSLGALLLIKLFTQQVALFT